MAVTETIKNALLAAFTAAGMSAVFTPEAGDPEDTVVDLIEGAEIVEGGFDAPVVSRVTTIEYLKEQIGRDARPGETFIIGEDTWVVQGPFEDPDSNDQYAGRVVVARA